MQWPRCQHCGERMCCDGKGQYECICPMSMSPLHRFTNRSSGRILSLPIPSDLTPKSLTDAIILYCDTWEDDTTFVLWVNPDLVEEAQEVIALAEQECRIKLIFSNPVLPRDVWYIEGQDGLIYSEGA